MKEKNQNDLDLVAIYTREDALRLIELMMESGVLLLDESARFLMRLLIAEIRRHRTAQSHEKMERWLAERENSGPLN